MAQYSPFLTCSCNFKDWNNQHAEIAFSTDKRKFEADDECTQDYYQNIFKFNLFE